MSIREVRFLQATEVRAKGGSDASDPRLIEGYASVFNVNAQLPGFQERMKNGAFTRAVDTRQDVVCLFNHDANYVLGRTTSGTLRIMQDDKGLFYSCDLPNTQAARDLHESIKRGDINGCSFAFTIPEGGQDWSEGRASDGTYFIQRTISDVDLLDVSPVTHPCYSGTSVDARCAEAPVELRSAVASKNEALKLEVVIPPVIENREAVVAIVPDEDSFQEEICEVDKALAIAFPWVDDGSGTYASGPYNSGRFYTCDTFENYVIVVECGTGRHFKIAYSEDEATEAITFGEMTEVEEAWVPADRAKTREAEFRTKFPFIERKLNTELSNADSEEATDEEIDNEYDISDRDKLQASYERLTSKGMDYPKREYVMGRLKKAAAAMGYEMKEAGVVSEVSAGLAGRSFEPFTKEERDAMVAHLAATFDPDCTTVRYSEDQPRDSAGRFGAGDAQAINDHAAAGMKHDNMESKHYDAMRKEEGAGNKDAAKAHEKAADLHGEAAEAHEDSAQAPRDAKLADAAKSATNAAWEATDAARTASADAEDEKHGRS